MNLLDNIPIEEREKILNTIEKINRFLPILPPNEIKYLFELWNEYVQPHNKQDIGCRGCVTNVFGKFKYYSEAWKTKEKSL